MGLVGCVWAGVGGDEELEPESAKTRQWRRFAFVTISTTVAPSPSRRASRALTVLAMIAFRSPIASIHTARICALSVCVTASWSLNVVSTARCWGTISAARPVVSSRSIARICSTVSSRTTDVPRCPPLAVASRPVAA